jgi:hypothetical protein
VSRWQHESSLNQNSKTLWVVWRIKPWRQNHFGSATGLTFSPWKNIGRRKSCIHFGEVPYWPCYKRGLWVTNNMHATCIPDGSIKRSHQAHSELPWSYQIWMQNLIIKVQLGFHWWWIDKNSWSVPWYGYRLVIDRNTRWVGWVHWVDSEHEDCDAMLNRLEFFVMEECSGVGWPWPC